MDVELTYEIADGSNFDEIRCFLNDYFLKEEPLNRALCASVTDVEQVFSDAIKRSLRNPFSTIVRNKNQNNEMAGVMLCSVMRRDDPPAEEPEFVFTDACNAIGELLNMLHDSFWELAPKEVNAVLHREICSVRSKYQRRGIATVLQSKHIEPETLKSAGIQGIVSETSSLANQRLLARKGFQPLREILHKDFVDANGKQRIKCDDGTDRAVLNFLPL